MTKLDEFVIKYLADNQRRLLRTKQRLECCLENMADYYMVSSWVFKFYVTSERSLLKTSSFPLRIIKMSFSDMENYQLKVEVNELKNFVCMYPSHFRAMKCYSFIIRLFALKIIESFTFRFECSDALTSDVGNSSCSRCIDVDEAILSRFVRE